MRCSFCLKSEGKLIAGSGVYICHGCVGLCNGIIEDERQSSAVPPPNSHQDVGIEDRLDQMILEAALDSMLRELSDRHQAILRCRFGLDGGRIRSRDEVSELMGVPSEQVRQIELKALAILRHPRSNPLDTA